VVGIFLARLTSLTAASALVTPADVRRHSPPETAATAVAGGQTSRRALCFSAAAAAGTLLVPRANAVEPLTLDDLPSKAVQAYQQYWPDLQLAGDYYVFELRDLLREPGRWDLVSALTESSSIGSAASVSKLEREFLTPMRILSLAFPPDAGGDEMQEALGKFQQTMFSLSRQARAGQTTGNLANPDKKTIAAIEKTWDDGRQDLNIFYTTLNTATSVNRLVSIPPDGKDYPRSKKLYTQLMKDAALCRNRGGQALAGLWGQLMVYGTVPGVNPCGNVNLQNYFTQ